MSEFNVVSASHIDRERRLQNAIMAFEFEDPQDGTGFDCAFIDAIQALKREFGPLANRLDPPGQRIRPLANPKYNT